MFFIVLSFKIFLASTEFISILPAKHGFLKKEEKKEKKPKMLLSKNIISCLVLLLFFFWNSLAYAKQPRLPNRFLPFPHHLCSHITFSSFQSGSGQNAAMPVTHASGWSLSSLSLLGFANNSPPNPCPPVPSSAIIFK